MAGVTMLASPLAERPYDVTLAVPGTIGATRYRMLARHLDDLAEVIRTELRAHSAEHVRVRLDITHSVFVRYGFAAERPAGTWRAAAR